jgi:pSer/pThr/pTyr-binding forkhead associated (FHA) protein/Flp pilus assembly protein TadD
MFKLIIEDDEGKTTAIPITRDEITIGRKEGNNIRLTERNISRHHARLTRSNGNIHIEDLDSYNGVRINGDRIQVKSLVVVKEGDLIEIGDYHLALEREGADAGGLAAGSSDEATQRVSLGMMAGGAEDQDEVTSQVAMNDVTPEPDGGGDVDLVIEPTSPGDVEDVNLDGNEDPVPEAREPTAIVRTLPAAPVAPGNEHARLVVVSTLLAGKTFALLKDEVVLGRTEDNDVQVDHRSVSRNHAKVVRDGNRWAVVDLGSANGVLVNGREYDKIDLRAGDIIEIGNVKLRFVEAGEEFQLSPADLERLRNEGVDETMPATDVTGRITRPAIRSGPAKFPVKVVAAGVGVAVVLVAIAVALVLRSPSKPTPVQPGDEAPAAASGTPDDGETEPASSGRTRRPPERKSPPPERDRPKPEPEPGAEAAKLVKAGQAALRAGDLPKARESFEKAVAAGDQDGQARAGLDQVDREARARDALDAALALKESDPRGAYRALLGVPAGTRAKDRATTEVKALKPRLVQRLVKDGEKALADGNLGEARDLADAALEIETGSREAQRLRERAEKAAAAKKPRPPPPTPAAAKEPPTPTGNKGAEAKKALEDGNRAILLGNFDEAVAKGKLSLKLDPSMTEAHKLLGVAYARQGRYCDAKLHYKKFIELNPTSPMVDRIKQILQSPDLQNCP